LTVPAEQLPGDDPAQRTFTERELRKYDGSRKHPVYIAYRGLVYDVTSSPHWRTGEHRNLHFAGQDLTGEIADAPHTDLVFRKFPVVGILKEE
jgi:predicted heme/steroid binding protein